LLEPLMRSHAPSRRECHRGSHRGLTLIELMIGLVILSVLASLAVPSLGTYLQRQRLKAAAATLEQDLREARYESVRRRQALSLVVSPGRDWCYAIATRPDCDCHQPHDCRLKTVRAADLRGVQLAEASPRQFEPATGNVENPGTAAVWQAQGAERVRVSISAVGRPYVCTVDGHLAPLPAC
jgi:prepilin-type N-terminal cleavage/methylation domain-containing protein